MTPAKRLILMGMLYKNLVVNGNFLKATGWGTSSCAITASDNTMTLTGTGVSNFPFITQTLPIEASVNKKVYYRAKMMALLPNLVAIRIGLFCAEGKIGGYYSADNVVQNQWFTLSNIGIGNEMAAGVIRIEPTFVYLSKEAATGVCGYVKEVIAYDITDLPAEQQNVEWCDANIPQNIIW